MLPKRFQPWKKNNSTSEIQVTLPTVGRERDLHVVVLGATSKAEVSYSWNNKNELLGGGFKYFLFSSLFLGK